MRARAEPAGALSTVSTTADFNPETDGRIVQHYNAKNFLQGKVKNKKALQAQLDCRGGREEVHGGSCVPA